MKAVNLIQLVLEIIVAVGYLIGLFPLGYYIAMVWVIPLTIVNMVLALTSNNKTAGFTIVNVIMAWLSVIPLLGSLFRVVGLVMSILSAVKAGKDGQ